MAWDENQAKTDARSWMLAIWEQAPEAVFSVSDVAQYLKDGPHPEIPWADVPPTEPSADDLYERGERPQTTLVRSWFFWWTQEGFCASQREFEDLGDDVVCIGPLSVKACMGTEDDRERLSKGGKR